MALASAASAFSLEDKASRAGSLPLVGGALCFNFTNTVSGLHEGEHEREHLRSYEHLLTWSSHAGAITSSQARTLLKRAKDDPTGATRALHRALSLREAIHDLFVAVARHTDVPERLLEGLNGALSDAQRHARLQPAGDQFVWGWDDLAAKLDAPIWPVLRSAADLLVGDKLDRVKQCPFPHCGWLFVDLSKNKSRRWCEMSVCGNRTKARRHYLREKRASN